jgi:hypothetical protein
VEVPMDHFVNLDGGVKFLFEDEVYVVFEQTVFANFADDGNSLTHDVYNVVKLSDGSLHFMASDTKVLPL